MGWSYELGSLRLYSSNDQKSHIKESRSRNLVIASHVNDATLRQALIAYYSLMREELSTSTNSTRHVFLFAYPTADAAKRELGEWRGRAMSVVHDGDPLPLEPEITIRTDMEMALWRELVWEVE